MADKRSEFQKQQSVYLQKKKKEGDAEKIMCPSSDGVSRTLFAEMSIMSELCALIYAVAYLVNIIGKGGYPEEPNKRRWWWSPKPKLKQLEKTELVIQQGTDKTAVKPNLPAANVLQFVNANHEALSQDPDITGEAEEGEINNKTMLLSKALDNIEKFQDGNYLWRFDHHFEGTGLVYGITVNRTLRRVTVVFRGSVTGEDWWQNAQVAMTKLKTPGLMRDEPINFQERIKVHGGFKRYLLDDNIEDMNWTQEQMDSEKPGKYGRILRDLHACYTHEENGQKVHEGFNLYVTGHSLGGALSVLLAMKLASSHFVEQKIKPAKPIMNISVAAPYVGNKAFLKATQIMEQKGWLRHVRVTNQDDVVPVVPPKRFLYNAVYERYIHCGLNVHLIAGPGNHEIGFGRVRTFGSQFSRSSGERHSVSDYWTRQNDDEEAFSQNSIYQLYEIHAASNQDASVLMQREIEARDNEED